MVTGPTPEQAREEVTPVHRSAKKDVTLEYSFDNVENEKPKFGKQHSSFSIGEIESISDEELDEITDLPLSPGREVEVTLPRTANGFGITIEGGRDRPYLGIDSGIYVTAVTSGSVAEKIGKLEPEDKIIEINGSQVLNVNHHEAVTLFKKSEKEVTLLVKKSAGNILRTASILTDEDRLLREENNRGTPEPASEKAIRDFSATGFTIGILVGCAVAVLLKRYLSSSH